MSGNSPEQAPVPPATATAPSTAPTPPARSARPAQPTQPTTPPSRPQATAQPAQPTIVTPSLQPTAATEPQTLRERLDAGDALWQWKIGFRVVLVLLGLIGIGCAAWTVANFGPEKSPYQYEVDDAWAMPWTLITFGLSLIWSACCILVFFVRRPNAPMHPGAQVGMDLVMWLAFIVTAIFAVYAVSSVAALGANGRIGDSWTSMDGWYTYSESNNTWIFQAPSSDYYVTNGFVRDCAKNRTMASYYNYGKTFDNCTEEDNYVNGLWTGKSHRFNTELTATVCQFLMLLIHFVLFVWACVDTNRRNSSKVGKDAEKMAADIVMKMIQAGAIIPAPGPAHMRPMPGQMQPQMMQPGPIPPQMMQQMFPQQYNQQFQQLYGHYAPQPSQAPQASQAPQVPPKSTASPSSPIASSSNEKGAGSRFA